MRIIAEIAGIIIIAEIAGGLVLLTIFYIGMIR